MKKTPIESLYRTLCVDPATGVNASTDESAITVCGYERELDLAFVLEEWGARILYDGLIEQIFQMVEKWKPDRVGIERTGFQIVLKNVLDNEQLKRGIYFHVEPLDTKGVSKGARIIEGLQPIHAQRSLLLQEHQIKLMDEMKHFRVVKGQLVGRSPNRLDSLAMHRNFWQTMAKGPSATDDIPLDEGEEGASKGLRWYGLGCKT